MKAVMFERALMCVGTDVGVPLPRRQPRWLPLLLYGLPRSLLLLPAAGLGAAMGAAAVAVAAALNSQ